jgi:hypothetical protein
MASKRKLDIVAAIVAASAQAWLGCGGGAPAAPAVQSAPPERAAVAAEPASTSDPAVRVRGPRAGEVVTSPLLVTGEARGPWFFEATFPVQLRAADGRLLAQSYAQAKGEWMTETFVPFFAELQFEPPAVAEGELVLEKANPSDLPEHAGQVRIPVRFAAPAAEGSGAAH